MSKSRKTRLFSFQIRTELDKNSESALSKEQNIWYFVPKFLKILKIDTYSIHLQSNKPHWHEVEAWIIYYYHFWV